MPRFPKPLRTQATPKAAAARPQPQPKTIKNGNEEISVLSNGDIEEIDIRTIGTRDGGETDPAVDVDDLEEQRKVGPKVYRYTVTIGGRVQTQLNGQRTLIHVGKPIDSLNFDITLMRRQGIEMEELEDDLEATG